jgi:dTDP-4-dehydrorhamnose reductase
MLDAVRPDAIVNAAAEGSVDAVQARPDDFYALNVEVPKLLARYCRDREVPLVHVSSNAVFGSDPSPYDDDSPYSPVNAYGVLKCQAEEAIGQIYPDASIVRPIQMYGWPRPRRRANLASAWISQLRLDQPIQVVDDVVSEPLWAADTADAIRRLICEPVSGPTNISGGEVMTLFEFARVVAQQFELDEALITPVPSDSFTTLAPRPSDTRFTLRRLRDEVGIEPLPVRVGLTEMRLEEVRNIVRGPGV